MPHFKTLTQAKAWAKKDSLNGYGVEVEVAPRGGYRTSDWFNYETTVATYENGRELFHASKSKILEMIKAAHDSAKNPGKQKGDITIRLISGSKAEFKKLLSKVGLIARKSPAKRKRKRAVVKRRR